MVADVTAWVAINLIVLDILFLLYFFFYRNGRRTP